MTSPRAAVALSLLLLASCRDTHLKENGCSEDKHCGSPVSAFRCEPETGACFCRTNDACTPRELCNAAGFCQERTGCEKNSDCLDPALFCDTTSGTCLSQGRCTLDLHCPLGQVCDLASTRCVEGCHTNGDCNGSSCRCGGKACACAGTTPAELAQCELGVCDPSFCADETFCKFGELCGSLDGGLSQCYSDFHADRRPYCTGCTFGGGLQTCGTGANYCLIDTAHPGNYYCGTDCSEGQACPRGYACQDVIVVNSRQACSRANPRCDPNPSLPCERDEQCKRGGTCVKGSGQPTGFCAGSCSIDEGDSFGYCGCQVDADCAPDTCSRGECSISRRKCIGDGDCRPIHCVDFNGSGGCFIGQNCAPSNGLSCLEVQ